MQGVFEPTQLKPLLSANWGDSLDPGLDEDTQHDSRARRAEAEAVRRAAAVRAGAGPLPPPEAPPVPIPPPARFTVKKMLFYVMRWKEAENIKQRPGIWGQYLVPIVITTDAAGEQEASPYKKHSDNATDLVPAQGFPGHASTGNKDGQPKPDLKKCVEGRDFVRAADPVSYWEIGLHQARGLLEEAESMDLAFARRMEGFGFVSQSVVWDCLDPDYDASDREAVMSQFMGKYMERFYQRLEPGNNPSIERVSAEALHKHKVFCKAWTQKHYKTLTPAVTAPAEALAGEFYSHMEQYMTPPQFRLTRMELARVLMRHPDFAPEFAAALHYYTSSLEQTRGARNANYKQISMMNAARINSYKRLGTLLDEKGAVLVQVMRELCTEPAYYMHPLTVDWYDILGQMPPVHRYFDDPSPYQGISESRLAGMGPQDPPWRFGRQPIPT